MDAKNLRELQAPIKDRYRSDPAAAVVTLSADGDLSGAGIACKVDTGRALWRPACTRPAAAAACRPAPVTCCWKPWSPVQALH